MTLVHRERLAERSRSSGIDVVIATRSDNVRYLTDMPDELAIALGTRVAVVARCDPFEVICLVAPRALAGTIPPDLVIGGDVRLYGRFHALEAAGDLDPSERFAAELLRSAPGEGMSFEQVLGDAIASLPSTLAFGCDELATGQIAADRQRAPIADGERLLRDVRQVKTETEVERLGRAAAVAEAVETEIFEAATPGADWAAIARTVSGRVTTRGGRFAFLSGGAGRQGGFMFPPRPLTLAPGHLIRLDLGLSVDGYWSDTGRSASIGEPSAEAATKYRAIRAGADAALAHIRPGITFQALHEASMQTIRSEIPNYRRHHTGHAIGLRPYDGPLVAPGDLTELEVGMVLNIEVPLYEIGWGGLQLEDTVIVESDGFRSLTRLDRELLVLPA